MLAAMRTHIRWLTICLLLGAALSAPAASGKVIKVLPHLLDEQGRHALSPSLYERDAYQDHLRKHPEKRSGIRFDVQWRAAKSTALKLKLEVRAVKDGRPQTRVFEAPLAKGAVIGKWTAVPITGQQYKDLGEISGWQVTLWDGETLLGRQASFLWTDSPAGPGKP